MSDKILKELEGIKMAFFASKHLHLKNYIKYKEVQLPEGVSVDDLLKWNAEKKEYIRSSAEKLDGIKNSYVDALIDRMEALSALQEKLEMKIIECDDVKELKALVSSLETVAKMYDDVVGKLNVDKVVDEEYEENKEFSDELFKEPSFPAQEPILETPLAESDEVAEVDHEMVIN